MDGPMYIEDDHGTVYFWDTGRMMSVLWAAGNGSNQQWPKAWEPTETRFVR